MDQSICSFEGCEKPFYAMGLCRTHRVQQRKGKPLMPIGAYFVNKGKQCAAIDCTRAARIKGMCESHNNQRKSGSELRPIKEYRPVDNGPGDCSFPGCEKPKKSIGYCSSHASQLHRGEQLRELINSPGRAERAYWRNVDKSAARGCWEWLGAISPSGYGVARVEGKSWFVHRYSYYKHFGGIPDGLVLDHLCRNKLCLNPAHLEAVTHLENVRRQGLRSNNTSGVRGVSWDKARNAWVARVRFEGVKVFVGRFSTLEEAALAVAQKRAELYSG